MFATVSELKAYHTPATGPVPLQVVPASTYAQVLLPVIGTPNPSLSTGVMALAVAHLSLAEDGEQFWAQVMLNEKTPVEVPLP